MASTTPTLANGYLPVLSLQIAKWRAAKAADQAGSTAATVAVLARELADGLALDPAFVAKELAHPA